MPPRLYLIAFIGVATAGLPTVMLSSFLSGPRGHTVTVITVAERSARPDSSLLTGRVLMPADVTC